ncbi:hypothetical protein AB4120_02215 [Cupriavidus sp. 2KB_3]|uniref:hypothetical protein n=1 Tax=Cupriavidus sp. 2KB_3 TaxID=3232980 RepID=UPI003F909730
MRWITALNLQTWAETLGARNVFPGMVADLIRASAQDISTIRFPNGDKGQVRGFDGVLEAAGASLYIPDGTSIWEFGVSADAATKANSDFEKRTKEVDEAKRRKTTFVFVTPRTWNNGNEKLADWVDAKKKLGQWKDVVYLDGSMIEDWLSRSPAVAARYARFELKLLPVTGVRSTDEFWDEYSSRFGPPLVEQVLLAGREQQAEALIRRLSEGVSKLPYAADAPDEVVAFAVAAIRASEPAVRYFLEAKTLVVDTEEAARQIAGISGLTFLPRAQARGLAGYLAQKGPTVVSAGADDKKHDHEVLRRPSSTELGKALSGMGFTEQEGYDLARRCGRSLAVLARLKPSGTAPKPEWLENGAALLPALLAGAWHVPTKADQEVLSGLAAGKDYATYEAPLRTLAKLQDPPIDYVKDVWALRASVDTFVHLGHLIGAEHLALFSDAAKTVFGKVVEPPKADEVFKPAAQRAADTHSRWLRDGMMNTLLHMAVLHEQAEFTVTGSTPQDYVNSVVRELPGLSSDHRLLASLQDQMALLAEAAPIPFVEALERLLEGDAVGIRPIFEEHKGPFSSHGYHYGILWGLELIAWDPQLLLRAALCLARLAEIDPGGSVSNRPINSLRSIFLSWAPNTCATAKSRMGVLARVLESVPSIAWQLITKLLPNSHDVSSPTQRPAFREFGEGNAEVLTYGVVWESQASVIDMAIRHAGLDADRWGVLIGAISHFPKQSFEGTAKALEGVLASSSTEARFVIWDSLRKEVNRHRTYAGTDWALPEEALSQLDSLVQSFAPAGAIARSTWLFDDWMPDLPEKAQEDSDPEEAINTARLNAIREVVQESGTSGLIELAGKVKLPQHVAYAARGLELDFDELCHFFGQALRVGQGLDVIAGAILAEGVSRFGAKWMAFAADMLVGERAAPERIAGLLMALEESAATWDYVKAYGDKVNETYWQRKHSYFVRGNVDELMLAIDNYLAHRRPLAALDSASRRMSDLPSSLLIRLLDESVQEINVVGRAAGTMSVYNIERAFDELRKREDVTPDDVAALEFRYLPVFRAREKPLVLHTLMVKQPRLFMDAICAVFKPANRESEPPAEGAEKLAVAAYELLTGIRVLPGQSDGDVDEQTLIAWCTEVRRIAVEVDREKIADQRIGAILAHAPLSKKDDAWPHEAVRSAIEKLGSEELERGVIIERFNMRGVYSKAIGEGGDQERVLARQSREWADAMPGWPRTAAMLMQISEGWLRDAERADLSAQQEALRW